jgi:hypothetical protein
MKNTKKTVAATALAAIALMLGACATSDTDTTATSDYGQVRVEEQIVTDSTPAIIPGPALVDSDGRVYTSSSVGSSGNAATVGTNTNVSIIPEKPQSTVVVTTFEPPPPPPVVVLPPPPPIIVAEVAPPPPPPIVVIEEPMISSVQEEIRPRMSKD